MKPVPSLIPRFNIDYSFNDFLTGLKALLGQREVDLSLFNTRFSPNIYFTNYNRSAIYLLLKSFDLPEGSKVGVPLYTCEVVLKAIVKAGLKPRFIDIDQNYTLDIIDLQKKIHEINALIVAHTFGRPADMNSIKKITGNLPIIEDCAHSIYSEYHGQITGTLSNAGVLSLPKYLSVGGGGMIILNDQKLADKLSTCMENLPNNSPFDELKHLIESYLRSFFYHKPWFGLFALPIGSNLEEKVDLMNKKSFDVRSIFKSDLIITSSKISSFRSKVNMQRSNSFFLIESLKDTPLILPFESKDSFCNYYLFPVLVKDKATRSEVRDYLTINGVDTSTLFSMTPHIARLKYGYENDCPYTEYVCDRILTIPNHYSLSSNELRKIVEAIKSCHLLKG